MEEAPLVSQRKEREAQNLAQRFISPHHARLAKAAELREHEQLRDELNDFAPAMRAVEGSTCWNWRRAASGRAGRRPAG